MLIRLQAENTTLATATAAGATSVTLADAAELDTGLRTDAWLVVDTEDGGSKEVRQVASVSGNTVTLRSPLSQAYAAGLEVRLAQLGDAAVGKFGGNVPHFPQQKYTATTAGVNFSSGWEMRLIQAEEALVRSQVGEAVGYMNQRRNDLTGLGQIPVGTLAEAWTALKAERAFELWLEARRLGDLSRWAAAGTPGTTFDGVWLDTNGDGVDEQVESMTIPSARSLCFPVGRSEKETNCNYLGTC